MQQETSLYIKQKNNIPLGAGGNHYTWGDNCDGWVLVDTEALSVKQECMPAQTGEALHYHQKAQQFFFILTGIATFEVENEIYTVHPGQGFHIEAGKTHRILNNTPQDLEFILSSQPSTGNDRFNCV
ncbi:cupin domain-containing protein [Foetidibacter luteolus]|uniref:cupin domain-containing protein n=1 Tax=Foetidibacter luteolus TaxID=2608880 RepID=UPI00129BF4F6|nr:cupin domain-containing protein [Foetidibacter luteolus]